MICFGMKQMILQAVFDVSVAHDDCCPKVLVSRADDEALVNLEGSKVSLVRFVFASL